MSWIKIEDGLPNLGQVVICYGHKAYWICRYSKLLTWKGRKPKFINLLSNGFPAEDVTHWTALPDPPQDIG